MSHCFSPGSTKSSSERSELGACPRLDMTQGTPRMPNLPTKIIPAKIA